MLKRIKLATVLLALGQVGVVACNHGTNYDPHHQLKRNDAPAGENHRPTPKDPATASTQTEDSIFDATAAITDRQWCSVRKKNEQIFFVDRFVFSGDENHPTLHDQLVFVQGQAPKVKDAKEFAPWTNLTDKAVEHPPEVGVQALTSEAAIRHADAGEQNIVFRDLVNAHPIDLTRESIGANGAVVFTAAGQKPVVLFDCQDYSPVFVGLEKKDSTAPEPAAPPAAPDAEIRMTVGNFNGLLKAIAIEPAKLQNSRWCSYKKSLDDVIVGTLEFGAKNEITLNHFKASALKMDKPSKKHFRKAMNTATISLTDARLQGNVISAPPLKLRQVADADQKRALIFDNLSNEAFPSSTAETFFECTPANDQSGDPVVLQNLTIFMNSTKR